MKKNFKIWIIFIILSIFVFNGCSSKATDKSGAVTAKGLKIAYIVAGKLGDQSFNDATNEGVKKFSKETGTDVTTIEVNELQDNVLNARNFAQQGYKLVLIGDPAVSELISQVATEFPDTHFIIVDGSVENLKNVTSIRFNVAESGFLSGAFSALMNEKLSGKKTSAFVGGMRTPVLERSQYSFAAGCEYVGGKSSVVYVGNFTDVAKAKEIALQLYSNGTRLVQAFAGGAGIGVYQAAGSLGNGYYAMGGGTGQFNLSKAIIASNVKNIDIVIQDAFTQFTQGKLKNGIINVGTQEGAVGIKYAPGSDEIVPKEIKDKIADLQKKVISKEIVPPTNDKEYKEFKSKFLK